jgi:hypothetical protein
MTRTIVSLGCTFVLALAACKGGEDPAKKGGPSAKAAAKKAGAKGADAEAAGEEVESLQVADGEIDDPGPVPPEASMAFFVVEGALLPLGCFDKDKGKVLGGKDCLDMAPQGEEARLASQTGSAVKKVGEPTAPLCTKGDGKKTARAVDGLESGADFSFGVWPRAAYRTVEAVPEETLSDKGRQLDAGEKEKLAAAMGKEGEVEAHQVAQIDVDGDGKAEKIYSVFIRHATEPERYAWSGAFLAEGGDLGKLHLLEKSKSKQDVFEVRAAVDLDGDGRRELWVRLVFEEGSGDRIVRLDGWKPVPLAKWTCGV